MQEPYGNIVLTTYLPYGKIIAMKLAAYLEKRGVTPSRFASEAGLQPSTVIRILNGERPTPGIETLAKIMRASEGEVTPNDFASAFLEPNEVAE